MLSASTYCCRGRRDARAGRPPPGDRHLSQRRHIHPHALFVTRGRRSPDWKALAYGGVTGTATASGSGPDVVGVVDEQRRPRTPQPAPSRRSRPQRRPASSTVANPATVERSGFTAADPERDSGSPGWTGRPGPRRGRGPPCAAHDFRRPRRGGLAPDAPPPGGTPCRAPARSPRRPGQPEWGRRRRRGRARHNGDRPPLTGSGTPIAAAMTTSSRATTADSISAGPTRLPAMMSVSSGGRGGTRTRPSIDAQSPWTETPSNLSQ